MSEANSHPSTLPPNWREVIQQVEAAVEQSLAELTAREKPGQDEARALELAQPACAGLIPQFEKLRVKLQGLEELTGKASAAVHEADAELARGQETVRQWAERSRQLNRTLAELPGKS